MAEHRCTITLNGVNHELIIDRDDDDRGGFRVVNAKKDILGLLEDGLSDKHCIMWLSFGPGRVEFDSGDLVVTFLDSMPTPLRVHGCLQTWFEDYFDLITRMGAGALGDIKHTSFAPITRVSASAIPRELLYPPGYGDAWF